MKFISRYIIALVIVLLAAVLTSIFITPDVAAWYASLVKPDFTPPNWIFAIVWTLLYLVLAVALARVLSLRNNNEYRRWIGAFGIQLCLNVLWALLFFSLHGLLLSVICIVILWFFALILTLCSWDLDRLSFWLLVPYFAWVTFALILAIALWWIN